MRSPLKKSRSLTSSPAPATQQGVLERFKALLADQEQTVDVATIGRDRFIKAMGATEEQRRLVQDLRPLHLQIIALHMSGFSTQKIADFLNVSYGFTSSTLSSPRVEALLLRLYEDAERELKALVPSAIGALRRALQCGDPRIESATARDVLRIAGKYDGRGGGDIGATGAEDILQQVFVEIKNVGIQEVTSQGTPLATIDVPRSGAQVPSQQQPSPQSSSQQRSHLRPPSKGQRR